MRAAEYDQLHKYVIIGDTGVGKSSLLVRQVDDKFLECYIPSIGVDFKVCTVAYCNKSIKQQIWDATSYPSCRFPRNPAAYLRGALGIFLLYDITDMSSFQMLKRWLGEIEIHASDDAQLMIVGTKQDLVEKRQVGTEEAREFAEALGFGL